MKILQKLRINPFSSSSLQSSTPFEFSLFNSTTQRRWKKPANTAQTRLENRTRDLKIDRYMTYLHKLRLVLTLHQLMSSRRRGPYVSVNLISRWNYFVGLNVPTGAFLRKYPHVFDLFTHPVKRNACCRITQKMRDLIQEEKNVIREMEFENMKRIKKLLLMSVNGTLHIHALRLIKKELGLPDDFRESIIEKYSDEFKMVDMEILALVGGDDEKMGVARVEIWREKEYTEKWLSEFEIKYAFPIKFPTGFKIKPGFRERLKNWQQIPYIKPYEKKKVVRGQTSGAIERFEKRAVAILHELLSLTVEKMLEVERLVHFRKDFGVVINFRELILKHPGIFYISTKGSTQAVFLREAYSRDCLVEPNPVYVVRRKMLELILMGCRNTSQLKTSQLKTSQLTTSQLKTQTEARENRVVVACNQNSGGTREGDFVIPILENFGDDTSGSE